MKYYDFECFKNGQFVLFWRSNNFFKIIKDILYYRIYVGYSIKWKLSDDCGCKSGIKVE